MSSKGKATYIFASRSDLEQGLRSFESSFRPKYILADYFDSPELVVFGSAFEISDLGVALKGDRNFEKSYLVAEKSVEIRFREIHLKRGGVRYAVTHMEENPKTIVFTPGGLYEGVAFITGEISTISPDPDSLDLYRLFCKKITHGFTKVHGHYLGPEAFAGFHAGARLTASVRSPLEYDLRL